MDKIALVLSGGGAKGAYQVGVWKALTESGLSKDIKTISATSIGAINAILFSCYNIDYIIQFWSEITRARIAPIILKDIISIVKRRSICNKKYLIRLVNDIVCKGMFDRKDINILVACSNLRFLYPKKEVYNLKDNIRDIIDIIVASCCIPCVYNHHKIGGKGIYFDGGINSRTPIELLNKDEYKYIIVVHNDNLGRLNPIKYNGDNVINIYPSSFQGGIYTGTYGFKREIINNRINKGYKDAMILIERMKLDKVNNEKVY